MQFSGVVLSGSVDGRGHCRSSLGGERLPWIPWGAIIRVQNYHTQWSTVRPQIINWSNIKDGMLFIKPFNLESNFKRGEHV